MFPSVKFMTQYDVGKASPGNFAVWRTTCSSPGLHSLCGATTFRRGRPCGGRRWFPLCKLDRHIMRPVTFERHQPNSSFVIKKCLTVLQLCKYIYNLRTLVRNISKFIHKYYVHIIYTLFIMAPASHLTYEGSLWQSFTPISSEWSRGWNQWLSGSFLWPGYLRGIEGLMRQIWLQWYWRRIYGVVYWPIDPEGDHGVALATLQIYFIDYRGYIWCSIYQNP